MSDSVQLFHTDTSGSEGRSSLFANAEHLSESFPVQCRRADSMVKAEELPFPTCVKIDVEGAELAVLQGFGEMLADRRLRVIIFEADETLQQQDESELVSLLNSAGFQLQKLERREQTAHVLANFAAIRIDL
jgi:hypothetical protein